MVNGWCLYGVPICHTFTAIMTPKYHKTLADRFFGGKVTLMRAIFGIFVLLAVTALTFGAAPIALAMALIMHPDGTNISGRSNGTVFQRNGIRRNFVMPNNPGTPAQTAARNRLSSYSSLWRTLTAPQLASWLNLTLQRVNRLGKNYTIKGKAVFIYLNSALDLIGVASNDTAPALTGIIAPESSGVQIDVSDAKFLMNLTNEDASMGLIVSASLPVPNGQFRGNRAIVNAEGNSAAASVDADTWTGYLAHYGYTPVAGDRIEVTGYYINNTTGETSPVTNFGIITVQA